MLTKNELDRESIALRLDEIAADLRSGESNIETEIDIDWVLNAIHELIASEKEADL